MKQRQQPTKPYWKMTAAELEGATKEFDGPIPASKLRPLSPTERRQWERMRKAPSRSVYILHHRKDRGFILFKANSALIRRSMQCAKLNHMDLDSFLAKGLQAVLDMFDDKPASSRRKSA
jgi:hypothetical protein